MDSSRQFQVQTLVYIAESFPNCAYVSSCWWGLAKFTHTYLPKKPLELICIPYSSRVSSTHFFWLQFMTSDGHTSHGVSSTNMAHCPFRLPLWIAISAGTGVGRCMFLPSLADAWQRTREKKMLRKQALFICQVCFESIIMGKVSSFQAMTWLLVSQVFFSFQ